MNYKIINSGSDGNALVIEDILIDCGVSFRKLKSYYPKLKLVLLTHIHQDHFNRKTISRLATERPMLRFGCCEWLLEDLVECGVNRNNIDVYSIGKFYDYKTFKVIPVKLYHDVKQCGYKLKLDSYKVIYATDTNRIDHIKAKDYDYYFIEGNYEDEEELHSRAYNEVYESRVKSTHLSKVKATEWLMENMCEKSNYVFMHEHKERKMIRTDEYYGGTYPEPNEVIDEDDELDFGWDLADMYYEDMKLFDE